MRTISGPRHLPGSADSFPRGRVVRASLVFALALAVIGFVPQSAQAASPTSKLNAMAARINRIQSAMATTERRAAAMNKSITSATARLKAARSGMTALTQGLYMGAFDETTAMLTADSMAEFGERVAFAEHLQSGQKDVLERVAIARTQLQRQKKSLAGVLAKQKALLRSLGKEQRALEKLFRAEKERLAAIERAKRARNRASRSDAPALIGGAGPFKVCPVDNPRAYSNDWGAPRSGGRTHEGTDILAPRGTPIRAPFDGTVKANSSGRGGKQVRVYGSAGYVFNAHLDRHAGVSGFVKAGTVIGYVGNTGNASGGPTHNHFEWHPRNGGAVNPYRFLKRVC